MWKLVAYLSLLSLNLFIFHQWAYPASYEAVEASLEAKRASYDAGTVDDATEGMRPSPGAMEAPGPGAREAPRPTPTPSPVEAPDDGCDLCAHKIYGKSLCSGTERRRSDLHGQWRIGNETADQCRYGCCAKKRSGCCKDYDDNKAKMLGIVLGICAAVVVCLACGGALYYAYRNREKPAETPSRRGNDWTRRRRSTSASSSSPGGRKKRVVKPTPAVAAAAALPVVDEAGGKKSGGTEFVFPYDEANG
mmetsp:Transcript_7105/g.21940  ORF Transcript_7105/g.21940 Transcript_7105/m.21940 type:complete len:249 (+) Transcript_7105:192-938(+)